MKAMTLLSIVGLVGCGLPQVFAQEEISQQPVVYTAPAVVYQAPVIYAAPVVYEGPVIYAAPVIYQAPLAYEAPAVYSAFAPGCDLTGIYSSYYVAPNVIIIGDPANYESGYYPNAYGAQVIYFGGGQAAREGYNFGRRW